MALSFSDSRNPGQTYIRLTFSTMQQSCFRFFGQHLSSDQVHTQVPPANRSEVQDNQAGIGLPILP